MRLGCGIDSSSNEALLHGILRNTLDTAIKSKQSLLKLSSLTKDAKTENIEKLESSHSFGVVEDLLLNNEIIAPSSALLCDNNLINDNSSRKEANVKSDCSSTSSSADFTRSRLFDQALRECCQLTSGSSSVKQTSNTETVAHNISRYSRFFVSAEILWDSDIDDDGSKCNNNYCNSQPSSMAYREHVLSQFQLIKVIR